MKRTFPALILVMLMWSCADAPHPTLSTLPSETTPVARSATYTLSGVVFEATPNGPVPVEGVSIEAFACQFNCTMFIDLFGVTDGSGYYSIPGMWTGQQIEVWVLKTGYTVEGGMKDHCADFCDRLITASGDTRIDFTLVRQ